MDSYLRTRRSNKDTNPHTHTRIGDKDRNITGGTYAIPDSEHDAFMSMYYQCVLAKHEKEYLTERQLAVGGPILVDLDLRYGPSITTRQHVFEHVFDLVDIYVQEIKQMMVVPEDAEFDIFVMEKPDVNILKDKTKDGIHIIFGVGMDRPIQQLLRTRILPRIADLWSDLPITNTWEDVLDEAVTKGCANWQMYGSCKPGNQTYRLKYHHTVKFQEDGTLSYEEHNVTEFNFERNFTKLSARYTNHPKYEPTEETKSQLVAPKPKATFPKPVYTITQSALPAYEDIRSEKQLDDHINKWFEKMANDQYCERETHEYTMALPEKYYGPGSYTNWMRVGWALANTSPHMFLTWLKFSSQEGCRNTLRGNDGKFDWNMVDQLWNTWNEFAMGDPDGLTQRSIQYWCKQDAPEKYKEIHKDTMDYYVQDVINKPTEYGLARVLHHMYKGRYVCVSIKNSIWYEYRSHRWHEIDSGTTLRRHISNELHDLFFTKMQEGNNSIQAVDSSTPQFEKMKREQNAMCDICVHLKTTQWKNNIMREAKDAFWDSTFNDRLDSNPYLMCFKNGVVDFSTKEFRPGKPEDCVSKCTGICYEKLDHSKHGELVTEIDTFFDQLFPVPELREYMWEHLASILIGSNMNQTFNIYTGSGANGKSIMVELMAKCLGTYKGTVPISLITQNRPSIGNTSSEIVQLKGVRYAVINEPQKKEKINEGIMKEITGGDPIQGRALFKDTITFTPQFKLVVCTNTLFDIKSNDDGTWRRIRVCDFKSKFNENPYEDEVHFPREEYPYQYKVNKKLAKQFPVWAPVLMSMLVEKAFQTDGEVIDRDIVQTASNEYRAGEDYLLEFANEKVREEAGATIKKGNLAEEFTGWFKLNRGKTPPQMREVYDFMDSKYGKYKKGGWQNVSIIFDE